MLRHSPVPSPGCEEHPSAESHFRARLRALQAIENRRWQNVPSRNRQIRRRISGFGFSTSPVHATAFRQTAAAAPPGHPRCRYKFVLSFGTSSNRNRADSRRFVNLKSIVSSPDSLRNQNVAEQHRNGSSQPNLSPPIPRGPIQRLFLPSVTHLHHVADPAHQRS